MSGHTAAVECDLCNDSGTIARFTRSMGYKCAGPVPDHARGCYEDFCTCAEGLKAWKECNQSHRSHP